MTLVVMLVSIVSGAVLQSFIPPLHWMGQSPAPILLGLVLYYTLEHNRARMFQAAILAGFFQDTLSLLPLGYSSFCFCVAGAMVSRFKNVVFVQQWITHMLFGALANAGVTLVLALLLIGNGLLVAGWSMILAKTMGSLLLGAVIIPLEFWVVEALDRMMGNIETREM